MTINIKYKKESKTEPKNTDLFCCFQEFQKSWKGKSQPNKVIFRLLNFSSTLSNLDVTNYLSSPKSCQCQKSKYYQPHRHIITGDLKIIECQAMTSMRICFQIAQIQRAKQDQLGSHMIFEFINLNMLTDGQNEIFSNISLNRRKN